MDAKNGQSNASSSRFSTLRVFKLSNKPPPPPPKDSPGPYSITPWSTSSSASTSQLTLSTVQDPPPPSPSNAFKKGFSKLMGKQKRSLTSGDEDEGISGPWNFQHHVHVNGDLHGLPPSWSTTLHEAGFDDDHIAALRARQAPTILNPKPRGDSLRRGGASTSASAALNLVRRPDTAPSQSHSPAPSPTQSSHPATSMHTNTSSSTYQLSPTASPTYSHPESSHPATSMHTNPSSPTTHSPTASSPSTRSPAPPPLELRSFRVVNHDPHDLDTSALDTSILVSPPPAYASPSRGTFAQAGEKVRRRGSTEKGEAGASAQAEQVHRVEEGEPEHDEPQEEQVEEDHRDSALQGDLLEAEDSFPPQQDEEAEEDEHSPSPPHTPLPALPPRLSLHTGGDDDWANMFVGLGVGATPSKRLSAKLNLLGTGGRESFLGLGLGRKDSLRGGSRRESILGVTRRDSASKRDSLLGVSRRESLLGRKESLRGTSRKESLRGHSRQNSRSKRDSTGILGAVSTPTHDARAKRLSIPRSNKLPVLTFAERTGTTASPTAPTNSSSANDIPRSPATTTTSPEDTSPSGATSAHQSLFLPPRTHTGIFTPDARYPIAESPLWEEVRMLVKESGGRRDERGEEDGEKDEKEDGVREGRQADSLAPLGLGAGMGLSSRFSDVSSFSADPPSRFSTDPSPTPPSRFSDATSYHDSHLSFSTHPSFHSSFSTLPAHPSQPPSRFSDATSFSLSEPASRFSAWSTHGSGPHGPSTQFAPLESMPESPGSGAVSLESPIENEGQRSYSESPVGVQGTESPAHIHAPPSPARSPHPRAESLARSPQPTPSPEPAKSQSHSHLPPPTRALPQHPPAPQRQNSLPSAPQHAPQNSSQLKHQHSLPPLHPARPPAPTRALPPPRPPPKHEVPPPPSPSARSDASASRLDISRLSNTSASHLDMSRLSEAQIDSSRLSDQIDSSRLSDAQIDTSRLSNTSTSSVLIHGPRTATRTAIPLTRAVSVSLRSTPSPSSGHAPSPRSTNAPSPTPPTSSHSHSPSPTTHTSSSSSTHSHSHSNASSPTTYTPTPPTSRPTSPPPLPLPPTGMTLPSLIREREAHRRRQMSQDSFSSGTSGTHESHPHSHESHSRSRSSGSGVLLSAGIVGRMGYGSDPPRSPMLAYLEDGGHAEEEDEEDVMPVGRLRGRKDEEDEEDFTIVQRKLHADEDDDDEDSVPLAQLRMDSRTMPPRKDSDTVGIPLDEGPSPAQELEFEASILESPSVYDHGSLPPTPSVYHDEHSHYHDHDEDKDDHASLPPTPSVYHDEHSHFHDHNEEYNAHYPPTPVITVNGASPSPSSGLPFVLEPLREFIHLDFDPLHMFLHLQEVAQGQFGSVYAAQLADTSISDAVVAVKKVPVPSSGTPKVEQLRHELELMSGVRHKHILAADGLFWEGGESVLWIRMELMERSLADVLGLCEEGLILRERIVARFASDALLALAYLHDLGLAHRDVRSDNILINSEGVLKLADFSNAVHVTRQDPYRTDVVGVHHWQAPEMRKGRYDASLVDVWSLGATVWEMAESVPPFADIEDPRELGDRWPPLSRPDAFFPVFHDFLRMCSEPPTSRPPASQLLHHHFIQQACPRDDILQVLDMCRRIEEGFQQQEHDGMDL